MKKLASFLFFILPIFNHLMAQTISVKGKVSDAADNELLVSAIVSFGKDKVTATNFDGLFEIAVP